ncbi:glycosyltransferase family 2 protein [Arabiibacter massiliensis]|uniref:glycosyltransferase family 2 protein n=1 Tax=Arabiibacter massiliensis TaxID=1870985 RepID=UPI0009BADAE0|nr:glycosyltransferase family A protein [Arabiibacter massiliensis]
MNSLVSAVVPVFNVEKYVGACLDSLEAQTYDNIEIVIVDDGSSDGSHAICEAFAARSRHSVRLLKQGNSGLSAARNTGIRNCSGDLVVFVDSDDLVSPLYIDALVFALRDSGCAMATIRRVDGFLDGQNPVLEKNYETACLYDVLSEEEYQKELLYQHAFNGAQWRIFARDMIGDDFFPVGLLYEDLATTYKYVHGKGDVAVLRCETLYGYRFRRGSIIRSGFSERKVESAVAVTDELVRNIREWYPALDNAAKSRCFSVCRLVFATLGGGHEEARRELWPRIVATRATVLCDSEARKRERLAALAACLGSRLFGAFCQVYNLYKAKH